MDALLPLKPNEVPFVGMAHMRELVNTIGIEFFISALAQAIEADFLRWPSFDKTARVAAHSPDGVIELMPTSDGHQYAFKYVNGHPQNTFQGLQTVTAFGALADVKSGYPILLSEMTMLTALRTAATSAMAARILARSGASCMAIIGNGAQSEFQAIAFKALLGISKLRLYDVDPAATQKCRANLIPLGFEIECCESASAAVAGAQIITTITADKQLATILSDDMIAPGVHINAVGGDCPGKTELAKAILERASIFVEYPQQTRIEGEIQQLDPDHPVTELWQVLAGLVCGRTEAGEVTVFDSVGFAIEDYAALRFVYTQLAQHPLYDRLDLIASPSNPKNLFGAMVAPAQMRPPESAQLAVEMLGL